MAAIAESLTTRLRTIGQFCQERPAVKPSYVRYLRFQSEINGTKELGVFKKLGSRVLVDPVQFDAWLESQQQ